jgi:hypothetical protein
MARSVGLSEGGSVQCRKFRRRFEEHDASKSTLISHTWTNVDHPHPSDLCGPFDLIDLGHGGLAEVVWKTREKGHCPYAFHLCTTVTRSNTISELDSKLSCE